jgi:uncharacterized protein YjdB
MVEVSPDTLTLLPDATHQFEARLLSADRVPISGRAVTWTSTDTTAVRVSATGLVSATAPGAAFITASADGKQGRAAVTVIPLPAASISVSPVSVILGEGEERHFLATALSEHGDTLAGRTINWATSSAEHLTIARTGIALALRPDTAVIRVTASSGDASASALVRVASSIARSNNFRLEVRDEESGLPLNGSRVSMATTDSVQFAGIVAPKGISFGNISGSFPGPGLHAFALPIATWSMEVSLDGYQPTRVEGVRVLAGQPTSVFVRLKR